VWRDLDGEIVVYSDATGDTHHLGALAAVTIRTLVDYPFGLEFDALLQELHDCHLIEGREELGHQLERTLRELASLKLACRSTE
jgi:PqqD family protein of HPr-rel-A system